MPIDALDAVRPVFRALAIAFVPETATATAATWAELERIVGQALAERPAALRRQLVFFIKALDTLALVRFGRRLAALDPGQRVRFLTSLERNPLLLIRRGVWGLRTLVMMGYYGQPSVQHELGYRATAAGWEGRK